MIKSRDHWVWQCRGRKMALTRPMIMGVINLTPDSFFDGGRYESVDKAVDVASQMVRDGADMIDVGAESTRPGAPEIQADDECARLLPVLRQIRASVDLPISVDTRKASVALAACQEGAEIVNDVSAFRFDPKMPEAIKCAGAGCVLMHSRGTPKTMHEMTDYNDLMGDIKAELTTSLSCAEAAGIAAHQIVIDPGIGFAKTSDQSLEIIDRLGDLRELGYPILVGPSRKSFIGETLKRPVRDRLSGTITACLLAVCRGANIIRVHDVREIKDAIELMRAVQNSGVEAGE